ncbi:hypothetical protein [Burkholderia sp. BCC0322]|uniref:hypothetical protein n=1 Tax=unclassified Burkholderia TaxID=2613784 RepID=UPI00158E926F|nr:hypothetical protein [Burkholderia sp. BCC0322]
MQRTLRLRIQINHVENGGRMIDVHVRVLPESTARRHAPPMPLCVVALAGEQAAQVVRPPRICVTDRDALPRHTRNRVALLVDIGPDLPDRPHSRAVERQSAVSAPIPRGRHGKSATLRSSDDPLHPVGNPTRASTGRIATGRPSSQQCSAERAHARPRPTIPQQCAGRVAGGPHRADLLSAPYPGIVVAATIRIAPRPASTPNVELVTP